MFIATVTFIGFGFSGISQAKTVVCKEVDSKISYKLDFNWTSETVEISGRFDNKPYKKLFKDGTAARDTASDKRFLAEGTVKQYVGGSKDCTLVETLYFDITGNNGKSGTVQKSASLLNKTGTCKAKMPAPDLSANTVEVTCS